MKSLFPQTWSKNPRRLLEWFHTHIHIISPWSSLGLPVCESGSGLSLYRLRGFELSLALVIPSLRVPPVPALLLLAPQPVPSCGPSALHPVHYARVYVLCLESNDYYELRSKGKTHLVYAVVFT